MIKGMFGSKGYELIAMLAIAAVIAVVIGLTAYNNYQAGYQAATLKFEKEAKQGLQVQLERLNQQLETANQTNLTVLKKVGEYQMLGEQTTDELQKILAKTAAMRVGCTFDTDSLPPKLTGNNADAALLALKVMYDLYGECAGRHYELIRYMSDKERL